MIKDRNIAPDAFISASKIAGGLAIGEVFYVAVVKAVRNWLAERVPSDHLFSSIAPAILKTVSYRNDYIVVTDGPYGISSALDLSGKTSVHLIGANGFGMGVGSVGGAYIVQTGAYPTITLGDFCEVAGLQVWNASGQTAIYSSTKQGLHIHHNFIRMTAASGITSGISLAGGYGSNYNRVELNKLIHYAGSAARSAIEAGLGTGQDICGNEIIVYGSCVYDYGIINMSAGGQTNDNKISDCGGNGTVTEGILSKTTSGSTVIGNRLGLPTTTGLSGGSANRSFVDNRDAYAGGATPVES